jgi:hypothetical protein
VALAVGVLAGCQRVGTDDFPLGEDDGDGGTRGNESEGDGDGSGGNPDPVFDCDPNTPSDCPDGEKCTPLAVDGAQNVYECVDDQVTLGPYDDCTPSPADGRDGCPAGWVCLASQPGAQGVCLALCVTSSDCDMALCLPDLFTDVPHCSDNCDPLAPYCGHPAQACLHSEDRFTCKFPLEDDVGGHGDPCDAIADRGCAPGNLCVQGEIVPGCASTFCCAGLCDLDGPDPCPSPATCNPVEEDPPPTFEHIGACYVPF